MTSPTNPTNTTDLTHARKVAEAATPGPWSNETPMGESSPWIVRDGLEAYEWEPIATLGNCMEDLPPKSKKQRQITADATFIATFDPPAILSLIAQLEAARAREGVLREGLQESVDHCPQCDGTGSYEHRRRMVDCEFCETARAYVTPPALENEHDG